MSIYNSHAMNNAPMLERAGRIRFKNLTPVYRNNLKNREFGKEAAKG